MQSRASNNLVFSSQLPLCCQPSPINPFTPVSDSTPTSPSQKSDPLDPGPETTPQSMSHEAHLGCVHTGYNRTSPSGPTMSPPTLWLCCFIGRKPYVSFHLVLRPILHHEALASTHSCLMRSPLPFSP
jgi:hypothetical protein